MKEKNSRKNHTVHYRSDYRAPDFTVEEIHLEFDLDPVETVVTAVSRLRKTASGMDSDAADLLLDGDGLQLRGIRLNGADLSQDRYRLENDNLVITEPPDEFELEICTVINPDGNKALSGLYKSNGNYCTQCEAEGFRRITYYLDRPDVLAKFTTKITGDVEQTPVLLSNGNLIDSGLDNQKRHYAIWQDPYPKPSYLFALVAGDLFCLEDVFTTRSGRKVELKIYVEHSNSGKCGHAMESLKKAMRWDEEVYGLEYDLDTYMIVAVDDFNMGAMENKGLNIFNSKYVLTSPDTATDQDYLGVEGVIAHEYFHNWTGNRVTCRDWFQLSLKEGLTVFRDQEFSADMNSAAVQRIDDVKVLRNSQFREDSSPMAHPVRPDSYVEINNFYTVTVYNKGAEVIRMLYRIIGGKSFHKGMELYFKRFDGMAVTCEDFVTAMEDASGIDLLQFRRWYSQAGTPVIRVEEKWDQETGVFTIQMAQECGPTPGQDNKKPFHIPVEIGLLFTRTEEDGSAPQETRDILHLKQESQVFTYSGLEKRPLVSYLRGFSAPVVLKVERSSEELAFLMSGDSDLFNRWEASNTLSTAIILGIVEHLKNDTEPTVEDHFIEAFRSLLTAVEDPALTAQALTLPAEGYLAQQMDIIEPDLLGRAKRYLQRYIGEVLYDELMKRYTACDDNGEYAIDAAAIGKRGLKNCCLSYLMATDAAEAISLCENQFKRQNNMTDVVAALSYLSNKECPERERALNDFYQRWKKEPLVVDKWFAIQAMSDRPEVLEEVKRLTTHQAFSLENPNKVRSLIGVFSAMNHFRFHSDNGSGYRFLAEKIIALDAINPQIAARLASPMISYSRYSQKLKVMMEEQLKYILQQSNISADVYEIVNRSLSSS